jgi:metal-responsive CopG/Arc/MetJ family transcriptional regulator
MPEKLLNEIDRYAEQNHMTRSGLLALAVDEYIHHKKSA